MYRCGDKSRCIRGVWQIVGKSSIHKIRHALSWCCLTSISLNPSNAFQIFLEFHHRKWRLQVLNRTFFHESRVGKVFCMQFHHHSTIAPRGISLRGGHAIYHNLFRSTCRRNDNTSRTHAKTIDSASFHLSNEGIFGSRKIFPFAIFVVVLDLVYQFGRMLQTHTHCQIFCFDFYVIGMEPTIHIACRMACGKNDGRSMDFSILLQMARFIRTLISNSFYSLSLNQNICHFGLEMYFSSTTNNGVSHGFNHSGKFVCPDVRMRINEN